VEELQTRTKTKPKAKKMNSEEWYAYYQYKQLMEASNQPIRPAKEWVETFRKTKRRKAG
jgi:hypothetical protein